MNFLLINKLLMRLNTQCSRSSFADVLSSDECAFNMPIFPATVIVVTLTAGEIREIIVCCCSWVHALMLHGRICCQLLQRRYIISLIFTVFLQLLLIWLSEVYQAPNMSKLKHLLSSLTLVVRSGARCKSLLKSPYEWPLRLLKQESKKLFSVFFV